MIRSLQKIPLKKEDQESLLAEAKKENIPPEDLLGLAISSILGVREYRREFLNAAILYSILLERTEVAREQKGFSKLKMVDVRAAAVERIGSKEAFEETYGHFRGLGIIVKDNDERLKSDPKFKELLGTKDHPWVGKVARRDVFLPWNYPLKLDYKPPAYLL